MNSSAHGPNRVSGPWIGKENAGEAQKTHRIERTRLGFLGGQGHASVAVV